MVNAIVVPRSAALHGLAGGAILPAHDYSGRPAAARPAVAAHRAPATPTALPRPRRCAPHRARPGLHGRDPVHGPHLHPWALLPVGEFGCGSVTTCWRRFAEWAHAGVFERLHELLLDELGQAGALDWSRISVGSFSLRAVRGGPDRRKPGRPGQAGVQAAPGKRGWRHAVVAAGDGGQHP
jgi:transposase